MRREHALAPIAVEVSERGRVVLELLALGMTNKELAYRLGLSVSTAKWHVSRLLATFDVPNRAALVQKAIACRAISAELTDVPSVNPDATLRDPKPAAGTEPW